MNYRVPAVVAFAAFLFSALPSNAQHGGFGGHISGGSSGSSIGHSVGHSFGHVFGHRSGGRGGRPSHGKRSEEPPLAGAALIHGRVAQLQGPNHLMVPAPHLPRRMPITEFGFGPRFGAFSRHFGFGFCDSFDGFPVRSFFFRPEFNCFQSGFFFDPFFFGGFLPAIFGTEDFDEPSGADGGGFPEVDGSMTVEEPGESSAQTSPQPTAAQPKPPHPDTLLQLKDGSMYGLTDYWVVDERLHYITNYGGENSIPLARIDFQKTTELNAERGLIFHVHPNSSPD